MPRKIAIVSLELDLHAHVVAQALREQHSCVAHVIAADVCHRDASFFAAPNGDAAITAYDGTRVQVPELDVIWWRRANQPQERTEALLDEQIWDFVSREWRFGIQDLFFASFQGIWVNDPAADIRATCKTNQLRVAQATGFLTPDTIITNIPRKVHEFFAKHDGNVIAKKIAGTPLKALATVKLEQHHISDIGVKACPAVYQELIEAKFHLRVVAFEQDVTCIAIESDTLDWRRNLNSRMFEFTLATDTKAKVAHFLRSLGLKMGILDLILTPQGNIYFLEVNPQGQFLFAEQRSGVKLGERCATFLASVS